MEDFIYARQSVDKEDSISIESQIELCLREVGNNPHRVFRDKGYSGKNTERPDFQDMMAAVRAGGARRIIVYRLDRISRSVLDFANVISELQKYGVEFVSITERFDTSTPIGKAMLMIVMVFAQLERETIQQRVMDAYRSRSRKGFYMGGRVPYGFELENTVMEGIKTCMYKPIPEQIQVVQLIFSLYAMPQVSFADVVRYLSQNGIKNPNGKNFSRMRIRDIITNPVYAKADASILNSSTGKEPKSSTTSLSSLEQMELICTQGTKRPNARAFLLTVMSSFLLHTQAASMLIHGFDADASV